MAEVTEDFGHRPVDEYEGTPEAARGVSHIVSAIVLGLVPREGEGP